MVIYTRRCTVKDKNFRSVYWSTAALRTSQILRKAEIGLQDEAEVIIFFYI